MTNQNTAAPANPLSDEYVNAVIQRHGYDSPESVIAQLHQWIGLHGSENSVTLLMYEAHKALSKLRAPVADERAARDWPEDFSHENGNYQCLCHRCKQVFNGHKRRVTCKVCHSALASAEPVGWFDTSMSSGTIRWRPGLTASSFPEGHPFYARPVAPLASAPVAGERFEREALRRDERLREAAATLLNAYRARYGGAYGQIKKHAPLQDQVLALVFASREAPPSDDDARQASEAQCSCPSGDGSLRWPCSVHPAGEAMFWYRPCSDGGYEGPIHNDRIEEVRKLSGAWVPLYAAPSASEPIPREVLAAPPPHDPTHRKER